VVLLGSCSLSFSHLVPVSPDDDLPDGGLLLGFGSFAPLLEPVACLFFAGQLDPSEAAGCDFLQVSLGYRVLSRLFLGPEGERTSRARAFAGMISGIRASYASCGSYLPSGFEILRGPAMDL